MAGYRGSVWFLVVCAALGAALAWRLAWEVTGDAGAAWFGWAALSLSIPIVAQAYTIFPDGLSGVLCLAGVFALVRSRAPARWPLVGGGAALALLPWLHTRNAILAGTLGLLLTLRILHRADRWRALVAFAAIPVVSAAGWFAYFWTIYGTLDPSAPYGGYTQSSPANLLAGVPGLLVDQQFGLLWTAPVLLVAVCGFAAMPMRGRRHAQAEARALPGGADAGHAPAPGTARLALELLATALPYALVTASYGMWWGGTSAPARFLVPVLWPLVLPLSTAWRCWRGPAERAIVLGLLGLTAAQTLAMTWGGNGLLTFTTRSRFGPFQEWAARCVDLSIALPSLFRDPPSRALEQAAVWLAALVACWLVLRLAGSSRRQCAALAVPLGVLVVSLTLTAMWARLGADPLRIDASRRAAISRVHVGGLGVALARFDLDGHRRPRGLMAVEDVLPALEVRTPGRDPMPPGQLAGVSSLRAGEYRIRISSTEPRAGHVRLELGRGGVVADRELAALPLGRDGRAWFDVTLPMDTDALGVFADGASSAFSAAILATSLWPGAARPLKDPAIVGRRYGAVTAFFPTDAQYAEAGGVWVKAGGEVPVVLAAAPDTTRVTLFVRNGPLQNRVEVSLAGTTRSAALTPNQETAFEVPWPAGARALALSLRAAQAFRPIDVDPASGDPRRLGVWIEFRP